MGCVLPWTEEHLAGLSSYETPVLNLGGTPSLTSVGMGAPAGRSGRDLPQQNGRRSCVPWAGHTTTGIGEVNAKYVTKTMGTVASGL